MKNPIISVAGVTRRYGDVAALDDVSFTIEQPSVIGLLGRNGAGKTTLMALLTGQDRPTAGSIHVTGGDPFESARVQDDISFIRDNQRYPDDYQLKHALRIAPLFHPAWDAALAARLVEAFRLPAKTKVKKYSRGQLSALGVVISLASRAPITFLDEPYLGLDATARQHFYDVLIEDYSTHPRTIIASTHLIDEMAPLFDHVLVLDRGRLVLDRSADDLAGFAFTLSGVTTRVEPYLEGRDVLHSHEIGTLSTVTVRGQAGRALVAAAGADGVDVRPASLQQIVSALGAGSLTDARAARPTTDLDASRATTV